MSKGIFALFAKHTMNTINTIKSYSATFHMPFITSGMAVNTSRQEVGYELYIRPHYARALLELIMHYNWREVWYLYNSNEGQSQYVISTTTVMFYLYRFVIFCYVYI